MALGTATITAELDINRDLTFAADVTAYLPREHSLPATELGRKKDLEAAGTSTLVLTLENKDGRFSPFNSSSPYWDTDHNKVQPGIACRVRITFNAVTYAYFYGFVEEVFVDPSIAGQVASLSVRDASARLEAAEVRRPLMRDIETGTIINRLLDDAEGELVANPRFKDDTAGWAGLSGGTITRMTTGLFLEGGRAGRVVSGGASQGTRYTITAATSAGQKVTAAVYVWADDDASVGDTCTLGITDNLGSRGTATVVLSKRPQRITVTGTYDAGSTARYLDVTTTSASNFRIGALHCAEFVKAYPRDIDAGDSILERVAFDIGKAMSYIQTIRNDELGGLFFFAPDGDATLHSKKHRWTVAASRTSQLTLTERGIIKYRARAADRVSEVIFEFPRWEIGTAGEPVFVLAGGMPRRIPPNGTLTIEAEYQGAIVQDAITPVANTDYTIEDSAGNDRSASVTLAWTDFGGAGTATFTDTSGNELFLSSLQVRGTVVQPPSDVSPARALPTTPPDIPNQLRHRFEHNSSEPAVQSYAEYQAQRFGDAQIEIMEIELQAPWPKADTASSDMVAILARTVGDRITITNTALPFALKASSRAYYIDSVRREVHGDHISAVYQLSPVDADFWVLGTSALGTSTVLAS